MDIKELQRKLARLKGMRDKLEQEHKGNELKYSYWGGYSLGELKGSIRILEDILDLILVEEIK